MDVAVGQMRQMEFVAEAEGDWPLHCHKSHHTMNAMGHAVPTMIGVDHAGLVKKLQKVVPDYMVMGERGKADMGAMEMALPDNTLPMMTGRGPFGPAEMGGMFTLLKVRRGQKPGDYTNRGLASGRQRRAESDGELPAPSRQPASAPAGRRRCAQAGRPPWRPLTCTNCRFNPPGGAVRWHAAGAPTRDSASHPPARAVKEQKPWGIAGDAARTVTLRMGDDMRFQPDHITVREGETIRFVVANAGKVV